jgi:DNA modification methylase
MFSFVGDTVVDPFAGTGTTAVAALETGRHSISVEIDRQYVDLIEARLQEPGLLGRVDIIRKDEVSNAVIEGDASITGS